jgi:hypothetical protein
MRLILRKKKISHFLLLPQYSCNIFHNLLEQTILSSVSTYHFLPDVIKRAGLAQSVERQALNLMVEGSSPSFGVLFLCEIFFMTSFSTCCIVQLQSFVWIKKW